MRRNQDPTVKHLTFNELGDAFDRGEVTQDDVYPCPCWLVGNGEALNGERQRWAREQVQHPEEFDEGYEAGYDQVHDL